MVLWGVILGQLGPFVNRNVALLYLDDISVLACFASVLRYIGNGVTRLGFVATRYVTRDSDHAECGGVTIYISSISDIVFYFG